MTLRVVPQIVGHCWRCSPVERLRGIGFQVDNYNYNYKDALWGVELRKTKACIAKDYWP